MHINMTDMIREHRIPAIRTDGEDGVRSNAVLVFVTQDILRDWVERHGEAQPGGDRVVDIEAGSVITAWQNNEGSWMEVITPADMIQSDPDRAVNSFTLRGQNGNLALGLLGMDQESPAPMPIFHQNASNMMTWLNLHSYLYTEEAADNVSDGLRETLRATVSHMIRDVANATEDSEWEYTAHMVSIAENLGDNPLPEGFSRYLEMKVIKASIAKLDPESPDAGRSLAAPSQTMSARGVGRDLMSGAHVGGGRGAMYDANIVRRAIAGQDYLCRQIFGSITRIAIEDLGVSLLTAEDHDALQAAFRQRGELLSGDWVNEIERRAETYIRQGMTRRMPDGREYEYSTTIASADGNDFLLVSEPNMDNRLTGERGAAYVYSWPTDTRMDRLALEEGVVATISPEEIPSTEEVERLRGVLSRLLEANLEPLPGMD